jgi:hypothetical protein
MCVASAWIVATAAALRAHGQGIPLSAHFGALAVPTPERVWEGGVAFDRFTDHTKPSDSTIARLENRYDTKTRHYALRTTLGINTLYLMRTFHWRHDGSLGRIGVFGGQLRNDPSGWFQNQFRHHDTGIDFVPVADVLRGSVWGAFASADKWVDILGRNDRVGIAGFLGGDVNASSLYHEAAVRLGVRTSYLRIFGWQQPPRVSASLRKAVYVTPGQLLKSAPRDPGAAESDILANTYQAGTIAIELPIHEWLRNKSMIPALEIGYTSHSGFFMARPHDKPEYERMPERFQTLALLWGNGDIALETYNDSPGGKDIGPTFGVRLYLRWRRLGPAQ